MVGVAHDRRRAPDSSPLNVSEIARPSAGSVTGLLRLQRPSQGTQSSSPFGSRHQRRGRLHETHPAVKLPDGDVMDGRPVAVAIEEVLESGLQSPLTRTSAMSLGTPAATAARTRSLRPGSCPSSWHRSRPFPHGPARHRRSVHTVGTSRCRASTTGNPVCPPDARTPRLGVAEWL